MSKSSAVHPDHMMKGALVLSAAAFLSKILSAVYKVPFQNLTGDNGFYVYQQIYPFYGIAVALALNGLPLFVSKLIAEEKDSAEQYTVAKLVGLWLIIGSLVLFSLFWFGAEQISSLMGDAELTPVVRSVSYVYLFTPFLAAVRGLFQGNLNMLPTGISQVGEQIVRIAVLLGVAYLFTLSDWTVYEMGTYAFASSWIAGVVGSGILFFYMYRRIRRGDFYGKIDKNRFISIGKRLAVEGLPLTAMSSMMILFQLIDSFTVYNGLIDSGMSEQLAMRTKGIYDRGQPFVQLGLVVGLGISTSALPLLRKYSQERKTAEWKQSTFSVLNLTILFSGAASVGLIAVMPWINHALFSDLTGIDVLRVYVLSILFASLISSTYSILQSQTTGFLPIAALAAGLVFKTLMNQFAVRQAGTIGSSYSTVISLLIVLLIMFLQLPKDIGMHFVKNWRGIKIGIVLLVMGMLTYISVAVVSELLPISGRIVSLILTVFGVGVGGGVFLFGAVCFDLFSEQEWHYIPFKKVIDRYIKR